MNITTATPRYSIPVSTSQATASNGNNVRVLPPNYTQTAMDIYYLMDALWAVDPTTSAGQETEKQLAARLVELIGDPNISSPSLFYDLPKDLQTQISAIYNKMLNGSATASELNDLCFLLDSISKNVSTGKMVAQDILRLKSTFDSESPMK